MNAIDIFKKNIERSRDLLGVHKNSFPRGRPPVTGEAADVLRAVIVFTIAALDSYFHDTISEKIMEIISKKAEARDNLPGELVEILQEGIPYQKAITLHYRGRPDEEIRKTINQHLSERTYQDPGKIEKGLKLICVTDIWEPLKTKLKLQTKETAKKYLLKYIKRRHQIVHEGDIYKSKKHYQKPRPISRPLADNCIRAVEKFVKALDHIIEDKISKIK